MLTRKSPCSQHLASGANDKQTFLKVQSLAPLAGNVRKLLDAAPLLTPAEKALLFSWSDDGCFILPSCFRKL